MVELSESNKILLFRLSAAILVAGVSVICFVLPGLLKEHSLRIFSFLHSFCTGIMLGMGFIVYIFESIAFSQFTFKFSALLSASSFISIVAMEHLSSTSSYDYRPVEMNSEIDDEGLELTGSEDPDLEGNERDEFNPSNSSVAVGSYRQLKFYPNVVLMFASSYDFLGGIILGFEEHTDFENLIQYLLTKALMSVTFGTVLESLHAPATIFQWFAFVFTLSSPFGILLGAYVIPNVLATDFVMPLIYGSIGVVSALAAGVFLNVAAMNMIPAELYSMDNLDRENEAIDSDSPPSRGDKIWKLLAFVAGFAVIISPFYFGQL